MRPLTNAEAEVIRALTVASDDLRLDGAVRRRVLDGISVELQRRNPAPGEVAGDVVDEAAWSEIGAAAAVGTLLASDVPRRRRRKLRHPAGAGIEPLEIARLSNRALALLLLRRWARGLRSTLRGRLARG